MELLLRRCIQKIDEVSAEVFVLHPSELDVLSVVSTEISKVVPLLVLVWAGEFEGVLDGCRLLSF